MAADNKRKTIKKNTSAGAKGAANNRAKPRKKRAAQNSKVVSIHKSQNNPLVLEIVSIGLIALSILMILSMFTKIGAGALGKVIDTTTKGLFGFGGYVLPFLLIAVGTYSFLYKEKSLVMSKVVKALLLFLCFISFVHLLSYNQDLSDLKFFDFVKTSYTEGSIKNGGLFGGLVSGLFMTILGKAGSYIILTALIIIFSILLTGKSFIEVLQKILIFFGQGFSLDESERDEEVEYEEEELDEYYDDEVETKKTRANSNLLSFDKKRVNQKKEASILLGENGAPEQKKILLVHEDLGKARPNKTPIDINERKKANLKNEGPIITLNLNPEDTIIHPVKSETAFDEELDQDLEQVLEPVELNSKSELTPQETAPVVEEGITIKGFDDPGEGFYNEDIYDDYDPPDEQENDYFPVKQPSADKPPAPMPIYMNQKGEGLKKNAEYKFPSIDFLNHNPQSVNTMDSRAFILENSRKLEETLKSFGVLAKVIEVSKGPTVTRYELQPGQGVKVSKISGLSDDLALNLAAQGIRIEAPIPGKAAVGIEIPNKEVTPVFLREVIEDKEFINYPSKLAFALGKDIAGKTVVTDIAKMPHMLIAGATGSGKSVCINTLITSIIYKAKPEEVKLLMVDPKVVELSIYNGIPHLLIPVVTEPKKAAGALNWAVQEMVTRYNLFAETSVRDLKGYNAYKKEKGETEFLPQIVIIIDELADLMMAAPGEVEEAICRLAQMARAAGLHLIIATQRPSVDVITGLIKANIPSRLAFAVSSGTDSRTVLDSVGAEKLLGKGDMLFFPVGMRKPMRIQGAFISDKEVESIVTFLKQGVEQEYDQEMIDKITASKEVGEIGEDVDEFFEQAVQFIIKKEKASASMLQRQFRIGYNRASRLIEDLEARGIVGQEDGSKPRKVLMTTKQWNEYKENAST